MSSKSTGTRKSRSPTPEASKEKSPSKKGKTILSKSIFKGKKQKTSHEFKSQEDLKKYLKKKYKEERKKNWWKYIIKIHPKRISPTIADDTPALFDGKNLEALYRLVAIKNVAKEMAKTNKEKANNFIINERNRFLNEDPEVNKLMRQAEAKIIDKNVESIHKTDKNNENRYRLNAKLQNLGVSQEFPIDKYDFKGVSPNISSQALLRTLPEAPKSKSSKRGGKKTRGKRSNRRVTKRVKS